MEYKLQTQPATPEREKEVEAVELLKDEPLSFQIGFYHLVDGLMLYPEHHAKLREQRRYKDLDMPFKEGRYLSTTTVGSLMEHRWSHAELSHKQWVADYTRTVLPYTSLTLLTRRAAREVGLSNKPSDLNFVLNSLWLRIFTQTEEGWTREVAGKEFVVTTDGSCSLGSGDDESKHHIDLVSPLAGYQVKTPRFLCVARNPGHKKDQLNNFRAQRRWSEANGLPVYYLIYDKGLISKFTLEEAERMCGLNPFRLALS